MDIFKKRYNKCDDYDSIDGFMERKTAHGFQKFFKKGL